MANVENFLVKQAKNTFQIQNSAKEWRSAIAFLFVLLLITCLVSIYSSYEFYSDLIRPLVPDPNGNKATTIIIVILLEAITQIALIKFWRFAFAGKIKIAVIVFLVSGGLYGLSWYTSCNGMAIKQGAKVDNTVVIKSDYTGKLAVLTGEKDKQIEDINKTIEAIRAHPEGWGEVKGRATILTPSQRQEIANLYEKIDQVKQNYGNDAKGLQGENSAEMAVNTSKIQSVESKYYNIVAILMVAQILFNTFIMLIYRVIERENRKLSEKIQESAIDLRDEGRVLAMDMITTDIQAFFVELRNAFTTLAPFVEVRAQNASTGLKSGKKPKEIGFGIPANVKTNDTNENRNKNDANDTPKDPNGTPKDSKLRICLYCGKEYIYKHNKQQYCCNAHRILAWEKRTGKKFKHPKK